MNLTKLIVLILCFVPVWGQQEETLEANESSAKSAVRNIVTSQITYSAITGEGKYAKNLTVLAEEDLISSELGSGEKGGYKFSTSGEDETFTVNADPIVPGKTGTRYFFSDDSGLIRWSIEGPATVSSPPLGESESPATAALNNLFSADTIADRIDRAEHGDVPAQVLLGHMYRDGRGVDQDYKEAVRWYRAAADEGDAEAQYNIGFMHAKGQGVPQDDKEAVHWYRAAAEQGHTGAQLNLALMYDDGQGVPQDDKEAARWYRAAAEQGAAGAQFNLGTMYKHGSGVSQDYVQAFMWYSLAASNLEDEYREIVVNNQNLLAKEMTAKQIAEAQRLAREWRPKTGSQ